MSAAAVILAAGMGTRMRSRHAKVLHRAGGLTLIERAVRTALAVASPDRVVVVTGHQAEDVERTLAGRGVSFVRQEPQNGTGHALACCRPRMAAWGGQLLVLLGDAPLLRPETLDRLRAEQAATGAAAALLTAELADPARYGRIVRTAGGDVAAIVEYQSATPEQRAIREINSGIYCFQAELLWRHLNEIQPNPATGELYLTDIVEIFNRHGSRVIAVHPETPEEILGVNTRVELAEADRVLRARKSRALMLAGVTLERPETVAIDDDVQVGADTIIEPFVRLLGATRIGEECRIGAGSILEGATIASGVRVKPYTLITDSQVAEGAEVGPFARLRSNVRVGAGAHIGNFAEMKNTAFGAGSKNNHVSYLGDATVGEKTNIGAGTIICNYDGERKHPTSIGDRAFVGSNSTLVAPVRIGDDSYVGAGSVITEDVPAETLALGRARQVNNATWVRRRRERQKVE